MKVKILRVEDNAEIPGNIEEQGKHNLPSFHDGWRFDFKKHSKKIAGAKTYVLVTEENPKIIEGCLILKKESSEEHYMAFIEIAPHNQGKKRKYERVAGCLISFACRLSHTDGNGYLSFHVSEEKKEDQIKLMALYSSKYYAQRIQDTKEMIIVPKAGQRLIKQYLDN